MLCEPAYRRASGERACADFAERLLTAVAADCNAFKQAVTDESMERLRRTRLETVAALVALPPDSLPGSWGLFSRPHAALLATGLRDFKRTPREQTVLARLEEHLASNSQPVAPGALLASMLLGRNFELPIIGDIEGLPDWLRPLYFMELLESPAVFNELGEAERYVDHLEEITEFVHRRCVRTPAAGAALGAELAGLYSQRANLIQAYFSPRNLRPLYRRRGDILAAFLRSQGVATLAAFPPAAAAGKIKLGILAQHFTPQTETYFTLSHFEHLDRARFDVTLYAIAATDHPLERYCVSRADRMVLLQPNELVRHIQRIRDARLDILLISSNMTAVTNVAALLGAVRLAGIQVASVSSPVTTGASHVDVLLSAEWNEPEPDADQHYTEHLERLPGSINYYAYQHDRDPATVEVSRGRLGIPDDALVFFSGANFFKILPELSATWARILAQVPGSVLLLMPFNPNWSQSYQRLPFVMRIREQLRARGVDPQRLVIIDPVPARADVHRVMGLADVYLDAFPFAGACSMLDSILAQMPAVVRRGRVGRSNHGAALLRMVGLDELICDSEEEYIAQSIALATHAAERQRIRERLRRLALADVPVYYDTQLFSSRVGAALERLYQRRVDRYAALAADGTALRRSLEDTARRIIGRNTELDALTGPDLVRLLIQPHVGAQHGTTADFLKIDAAGYDFDLLESLDFERVKPELVLVEYGMRSPGQTSPVVDRTIADMAARGYGALLFGYADDGHVERARRVDRLTALRIDQPLDAPDAALGNILFYPAGDTRLLVGLQALLDSCESPHIGTSPAG